MTNQTLRTVSAPQSYAASNDRMMAETILANTREIGGVRIGLLPLNLLFVDPVYQRPAKNKVQKIAKEFDFNKCGLILVSYRENESKFAVIDGGNRLEAAKLIGRPAILCQILTGLSIEQEAKVFAAQNENRVRLTANDVLKAQVCAGDKIAIGFQTLCKEFGVKLYINNYTKTHAQPHLVCVKAARRFYEQNAEALRWVFSMICKAGWNTVKNGFSVYTVSSLFHLYESGSVNEIERKLLPVMRQVSPAVMLAKAQTAFIGYTRTEAMTSMMRCIVDGTVPALGAA